MEDFAKFKLEDILDAEGQKKLKSLVAKLTMLSVTSRPDIAFASKLLARKYDEATREDVKEALKVLKYVKETKTVMKYPDLGDIADWILVGFADASNNSLCDKVGSIEGQVMVLANKKTERACILGWRSKQINRVVHSSLAAEGIAILNELGDLRYAKTVLSQIYGTRMLEMPTVAVTDSKNL